MEKKQKKYYARKLQIREDLLVWGVKKTGASVEPVLLVSGTIDVYIDIVKEEIAFASEDVILEERE